VNLKLALCLFNELYTPWRLATEWDCGEWPASPTDLFTPWKGGKVTGCAPETVWTLRRKCLVPSIVVPGFLGHSTLNLVANGTLNQNVLNFISIHIPLICSCQRKTYEYALIVRAWSRSREVVFCADSSLRQPWNNKTIWSNANRGAFFVCYSRECFFVFPDATKFEERAGASPLYNSFCLWAISSLFTVT
jgi:hypothetical protein